MDQRRRAGAAEAGDDVGHGVAVADDQYRAAFGADAGEEGGRVGGIVDDRGEVEPLGERRGGLAGAAEIADIDRDRLLAAEIAGESLGVRWPSGRRSGSRSPAGVLR